MQKPAPLKRNSTAALLALLVAGCSGGGQSSTGTPGTSGDFVVLRNIPSNNGQLFLNQSIAFEFSNDVDLSSADFNSVSFAVFDLNGNQLSEPVEGKFVVFKEIIKESIETIEQLYQKKENVTGIATGFVEFDSMTSGLQPSDLIVVTGRPTMGKSALVSSMAEHAAIVRSVAKLTSNQRTQATNLSHWSLQSNLQTYY